MSTPERRRLISLYTVHVCEHPFVSCLPGLADLDRWTFIDLTVQTHVIVTTPPVKHYLRAKGQKIKIG